MNGCNSRIVWIFKNLPRPEGPGFSDLFGSPQKSSFITVRRARKPLYLHNLGGVSVSMPSDRILIFWGGCVGLSSFDRGRIRLYGRDTPAYRRQPSCPFFGGKQLAASAPRIPDPLSRLGGPPEKQLLQFLMGHGFESCPRDAPSSPSQALLSRGLCLRPAYVYIPVPSPYTRNTVS